MSHAEMTMTDTFTRMLGSEQAGRFAEEINQGILQGLTGRRLREYIANTWKKYKKYRRALGYPDDEITRIAPC